MLREKFIGISKFVIWEQSIPLVRHSPRLMQPTQETANEDCPREGSGLVFGESWQIQLRDPGRLDLACTQVLFFQWGNFPWLSAYFGVKV